MPKRKNETQQNNMVLRGSIYHCRLDIPKDLKEHYKFQSVLSESLGTGDKRLANEKRDKLISQWKAEFRTLRQARISEKENLPDWREPLAEDAKRFVKKFDNLSLKVYRGGELPDKQIVLTPKNPNSTKPSISDLHGKPEGGTIVIKRDKKKFLDSFESDYKRILTGKYLYNYDLSDDEQQDAASIIKAPNSFQPKSPITPAMIKDWKTHLQTQYDNNKTIDGHEFHIRRLSQWLNEVNKPLDFDSIAMFLKTVGNKRATLNKYLSSYRNFWEWANRYNRRFREQFENKQNPFKDHSLPKNKESRTSERTPFTVKEVEWLFQEAFKKGDHELAYLIAFASYTGARREEIGRISQDSTVFKKGIPSSFKIEEAKTKAGVREVPIHSALVPLYTHLLKQSDENGGFLFSGSKNKYDKRMDAIGKRFGRLKTDLGFSSDHVFHSIRKTAITSMHEQNVPVQEVLSYIVGHESGLITLDVYSGGATMKQKREAIEKLKFNFAQIKSFS